MIRSIEPLSPLPWMGTNAYKFARKAQGRRPCQGKPGLHILVVDDDPKVRTLLRRCFEGEGFAVSEAKDGRELRAQLDRQPISLITLDLNLGVENGLDLAREVRKERNVPIIMLTGKGDAIDRVVGLELGADDYLAKPFELRELLARVRAVLRRSSTADYPEPLRAALCVRRLGARRQSSQPQPRNGRGGRSSPPANSTCWRPS